MAILFLDCSYSWGYKRAFEEYSTVLREKYPELTIIGDNFPPPTAKHYLALAFNVVKLLTIALIVINVDPFAMLGLETPTFWVWLASNRIYGCLMTFFISNTIEGQLISTGAFEISYNGMYKFVLSTFKVLITFPLLFRCARLVKNGNRSHSVAARTVPNNRQPQSRQGRFEYVQVLVICSQVSSHNKRRQFS